MNYDIKTRKIGDGYTYWRAHEDNFEYGNDLGVGGTPTSSSGTPANAFDDQIITICQFSELPAWIKYDFGAGNEKQVEMVCVKTVYNAASQARMKDFTIKGSLNDSEWDLLHTGQHPDTDDWEIVRFNNATAYRYIKIDITTKWSDDYGCINEMSMHTKETVLRDFCVGGVKITCDGSPTSHPWRAFCDNVSATFVGDTGALPHWFKIDLGAGIKKVGSKLRIQPDSFTYMKDFKLEGSNNDSDWTELLSTEAAETESWQEFNLSYAIAYRYYKLTVTTVYGGTTTLYMNEMEIINACKEIIFNEMLKITTDLGGYSADTKLSFEVESEDDEIQQEVHPVQEVPISAKGTFQVTMSTGDAKKLAVAAGYKEAVSETDILGTGSNADTVLLGVHQPKRMTLMHVVPNNNESGKYDYFYIPNVTVDPTVILKFNKGVRVAEVTFNLNPSEQVLFLLPNGKHAVYKVFYQKT